MANDIAAPVPRGQRLASWLCKPKTKPPSRANIAANKVIVRGNVWIYRKTRGRVLGKFGRMDALLLTTRGRKTGKRRTNPVTYLYDRGRFVVCGAYGGEIVHPAWYGNLRAVPKVTAEIGLETVPCTAHVEPPGPERDRLWQALCDASPAYRLYQNRTDRLLPVVVLTPDDLAPPSGEGR
jgi:deazaflavin-dependent oxidoreductase (nitroreductase family)